MPQSLRYAGGGLVSSISAAAPVAIAPDSSSHQSEVSIAIDPNNSDVVLSAFRTHDLTGNPGPISINWSSNGGFSWAGLPVLPGTAAGAADPVVGICRTTGNWYCVYLDTGQNIHLAYSTDQGASWSNSPITTAGGNDKPWLGVDNVLGSQFAGRIYVCWQAGGIQSVSSIQGASLGTGSWSSPYQIPPMGGADFGVQIGFGASGEVVLAWGVKPVQLWPFEDFAMTTSDDGGATWAAPWVAVSDVWGIGSGLLEGSPDDFRWNSMPSMVVDRSGGPGAEIAHFSWTTANGQGDIFHAATPIVAAIPRAAPHTVVNPTSPNYAQFMPAIGVDQATGILSVVYYSRNGPWTTPMLASSTDAGLTWSGRGLSVPTLQTAIEPNNPNSPYFGDYNSVAVSGSRVLPCWWEQSSGVFQMYVDVDMVPRFANLSTATGISIPEGSGQATSAPLDFDEDGKLDLLVSFDSSERAQLNHNTFIGDEAPQFNNLAQLRLHTGTVSNTTGVAAVDCLGNDGNVDIFIGSADSNLVLAGDGFDFTGPGADQSALLGTAQTLPSAGASFGDFNGDRWLDLLIMSSSAGSGDVLLQSNAGAGFVDVTAAAGLHSGMTSSTSAVWADMNLDNRLDLFVGYGGPTGPANEWSPYYLNQGPDGSGQVTFTDVAGASSGPRIDQIGHVQGVELADISGDRKLDILIASNDPATATTLIGCLNDGTGAFEQETASMGLSTQTPLIDVEVTDLNGNGVLDIVCVPEGTAAIEVFSGYGDLAERGYRDATFEAALGSNPTYGLTLADFNSDTDADIFLLRPEVSADPVPAQFYWANSLVDAASPPASPKAYTVEFDRWSQSQNPNSLGIGATVTSKVITSSGKTLYSTQVVDGGSGRAGQGSSRLTFGLAGASTAEITVRWPHGQIQVFDAASSTGFPNVVLQDSANPEIQSSSVTASYVPSSSYTTHTYSWKTNYNAGTPQVLIDAGHRASQSCMVPLGGVSQIVLDPSMGGVSAAEPLQLANGQWQWTLTWNAYCSSLCTYTYYARQNVGGQVYSSSSKSLFIGSCAVVTQ